MREKIKEEQCKRLELTPLQSDWMGSILQSLFLSGLQSSLDGASVQRANCPQFHSHCPPNGRCLWNPVPFPGAQPTIFAAR